MNRSWPAENIHVLYEHVSEGVCPYCGEESVVFSNADDRPEVVLDRIPEYYANWFTAFLADEVPVFLKEECSKITYTPHLTDYSDYEHVPYADGFAGGRDAYIKLQDSTEETAYIIFHELAHCYDCYDQYTCSLNRVDDRYYGSLVLSFQIGEFSHTEQWLALHEAEGNTAAQWYNSMYWDFTEIEQQTETFAIAVGKYFTAPNTLKAYCPGMYAYVDDLFGEMIAYQAPEEIRE